MTVLWVVHVVGCCIGGALVNEDIGCRLACRSAHGPVMCGPRYEKGILQPALATGADLGDSVICDNLPAHQAAEVQDMIEAQGATIKYRPSYSLNLNPIKQVLAKLKTLLRQAEERTDEALWRTVGQLKFAQGSFCGL